MLVTWFERLTSVTPQVESLSWNEFIDALSTFRFEETREYTPLFSPAEWAPGATRSKRGVVRVHFGVLDLDDIDEAQLEQISQRIEGTAYLFYTTWSHAKHPICARLVFPFSRPVEAAEWPSFWIRMRAYFHNLPDPKCKDQSRIYYVPCAPIGTEDSAIIMHGHGAPLDVDELMRGAVTEISRTSVDRTPLTRDEFVRWCRNFRPSRNPYAIWMKSRLMLLLEGEPLAEVGDRDNTIFKMVTFLVEQFPLATAQSIAALFEQSVARMGLDIDMVLAKIERHQDQLEEAAVAAEAEQMRDVQRRIRLAFNSDRDRPYSHDELALFADRAGCSMEDFQHRWVIKKDNTYFFFVNGEYLGPHTHNEVEVIAPIYLAPASSAGVELYTATKNGIKPKTANQLVQQYGQVAMHIVLDFTAQASYYDQATRTLVEAPTPRRPLEPTYSPTVARWLRALAGPEHDLLLDWLAVVTRLNEPCSALYLEGAKGAGKTLLAHGIAAIWSEDGPASLEDAFASWNSQLVTCPVVFGDEVMPTDFQGRARTGQLRQFVQARQRTLKRKYIPDSTLRGCIRLVLAANNKEMFATNEHLTVHDIEAIVDRVLHIHVTEEAAAIFQSGVRITPDEIARHTLWLVQERGVVSQHRFLVAGKRTDLHRSLTTGTGLRSAVCHWLVAYLLEPNKVDVNRTLLVRRYEGSLLATARGLARFWSLYETNVRPPAAGALSRALSGLSHPNKRLLTAGDGRPTWYWQLDTENLVAWAEETGYASRETIEQILAQGDTKLPAAAPSLGAN